MDLIYDMLKMITICLKKYTEFKGRASRSEYWYWALFIILSDIILYIIEEVVFGYSPTLIISLLFLIIFITPTVSVSVRRLHDINKSGKWLLLALFPIIGWIILFIWSIKKGDEGDNEFGSDPLKSGT
ncbi:MAG: DUF805 domain-containing protein [Sphingobacteriia bacterium]|nr:DUF805 domain-containing protein [Sphingobacteriia bacterium]